MLNDSLMKISKNDIILRNGAQKEEKNKWIKSGKTIRNNIKRPDSYCSGVSLYNPLT